jgi:hypothetical protein
MNDVSTTCNVSVAVRIRPLDAAGRQGPSPVRGSVRTRHSSRNRGLSESFALQSRRFSVDPIGRHRIVVRMQFGDFEFDSVVDADASQEDVFSCCMPAVLDAFMQVSAVP